MSTGSSAGVRGIRLRPQSLSGIGVRQAGDGADTAGRHLADGLEFRSGIEPQLVRFFLPVCAGLVPASKHRLWLQQAPPVTFSQVSRTP